MTKCYWCFMLIFSMFCCIAFTLLLSRRFLEIPIRMTIKNKQALTEDLPLPAITFCSENPTTDKWIVKFLENKTLPPDYSRESVVEAMRHALSQMSPRLQLRLKEGNVTLLAMVDQVLQVNDIKPRDFMSQVSVPCDVLLRRCQVRGEVLPCGDIFTRVRGQCCRFIDNAEDFHSSGQGFGNSLIVVTTMDYGDTYFMVHQSDSETIIDQTFFFMENGYYVMFYIDPIQILKSEEVHEVEEESGACLHPDEQGLRYFDKYDYYNCATELSINISMALCDCAATYYPAPDQFTCNFTQMDCILKNPNINKKVFSHPTTGVERYILDPAKRKGIQIWEKCPNSCEYISYKLSFKPRSFFPNHEYTGFFTDMDPANEYVMHFNYESQFYTIQEFHLISDWITLLSNLGGVFGLFLGCSMLTLAEIMFYLWRNNIAS